MIFSMDARSKMSHFDQGCLCSWHEPAIREIRPGSYSLSLDNFHPTNIRSMMASLKMSDQNSFLVPSWIRSFSGIRTAAGLSAEHSKNRFSVGTLRHELGKALWPLINNHSAWPVPATEYQDVCTVSCSVFCAYN